eukprot:GFUD01041359.1.p1 GENE.GFUD01041359.1~~GFUD01041359.1.p1  ORF type:complete len:335 (+),score=77.76 GFUD01041359.1:62-1066(+)
MQSALRFSIILALSTTTVAQSENISHTSKSPPLDPLQSVMLRFSLSEQEVLPLLNKLDSVGQQVNWLSYVFSPRRTLLVIDMQNDFITGSLNVADAEEIVNPIAELIKKEMWNQVIYSQDWHPKDHISFFSNVDLRPLDETWLSEHPGNVSMFEEVVFKRYPPYAQVLWPDHCVQGSQGAEFHSNITTPKQTKVIQKGTNPMIDSYSAFFDNTGIKFSGSTGLRELVKGSTEVVVVGLAMDYCVGFTSLHSLELGYPTTILRDMTRPVNKHTGEDMMGQVMREGGQVSTWNRWQNEMDDWERAKEVAEFLIQNASVIERYSLVMIASVLALILM